MKIHSSCEIEDFVETHLCKLCVILRSHYKLCVLIKDIGRRLPLQLQCSYQGQQSDYSQSVRWNYKTRFWGGQNLTAVEGNVSFYQVNLVSRITGEDYMWPKPLENPSPPPLPRHFFFFFVPIVSSCINAPLEIRQSNKHFHALDIASLPFQSRPCSCCNSHPPPSPTPPPSPNTRTIA